MKTADINVDYIGHFGSDLNVVNAARVSFHKESEWNYKTFADGICREVVSLKDEKLISYLARHKHTSPFNHCFISVRVKAPIFVARQLVKHKFMPWNEVSRRYVDDEPEFYFPPTWRSRAENVKQGSSDNVLTHYTSGTWAIPIDQETKDHCTNSVKLYNDYIQSGVAPEQARMVLPQNTMTEWIWSGTLGAFCDMLKLRLDSHTQHETSVVAEKIKNIILPMFPVSVPALLEN